MTGEADWSALFDGDRDTPHVEDLHTGTGCVRDLIAAVESEYQEQVRNNIILAGGTSAIPGFGAFLENSLREYGGGKIRVVDTAPDTLDAVLIKLAEAGAKIETVKFDPLDPGKGEKLNAAALEVDAGSIGCPDDGPTDRVLRARLYRSRDGEDLLPVQVRQGHDVRDLGPGREAGGEGGGVLEGE